MISPPRCPICHSDRFHAFASSLERSPLHRSQVRCAGCGLVAAQPQASDERLAEYYAREYYDELHPDARDTWARYYERLDLPLMKSMWADWPPPPGAAIVDVGCGYGDMLALLRGEGYVASGCDPSPRAVEHCVRQGIDVQVGVTPGLPFARASFDVALSLQVIEHVRDPSAFTVELADLVRPGGVVVLATEKVWTSQYVFDRARAIARGRVPPYRSSTEHTFVFEPRHLHTLLERAGCRDVRVQSYVRTVDGESPHWRIYKGIFRALDRWLGTGEFLMAVARRK